MPELTPDERWVLKYGFYQYADPFKPYSKETIITQLMPARKDTRPILKNLIDKKVLSESPDKTY
jgi:hypothetical protein